MSNVRSVVHSGRLGDATVVAGAAGIARPVSRPRLVANGEQFAAVGAHELAVATADALTNLDALGDDVAGVVVVLADGDEIPREVVAVADRRGLPVVTVAGRADADAVAAAILELLLTEHQQRLDRMLDIHQRFTQIGLAGGGTAEIATALHELLGVAVAVRDVDGHVTVAAPADAAAEIEQADSVVRQPVEAGDQHYGEIVARADALDTDGVVALERAAVAIAVRLAQASALAETQERFAAISLEELISGQGDVDDIVERASSFGWNLARPRAVLLASIDPPEEGSIPEAALHTIAAAARATLGRDAIVWTRSATIAALLAPDTDEPDERRAIADALRAELDDRLRSVTVSIGVGRRVEHPADLHRSFVEATNAVYVGRWAKGRHVTQLYDELGLERLLAATPSDDLAEFVERAIGPVVQYDRENQTELVPTLAAWLDTRNMAEAARSMGVHYNTLKNRLERVEAIIGPVLEDSARALECEVAMYVYRHYDGPWKASGRR